MSQLALRKGLRRIRCPQRCISTVTLPTATHDDVLASIKYPKQTAEVVKNDVSPTPTPPKDLNEWQSVVRKRQQHQAVLDHFENLGSTQTRDLTFQPHHSLHRAVAPHDLTMSALMATGAHLGHAKTLLRPAFLPYAYGTRADITIIDLESTLPLLRRAANVVRAVAQNGGTVVFVGSNEALRPSVIKAAQRMGRNAYHVGSRWKPGTLTNSKVVFGEEIAQEQNTIPDLVVFLNPLDNLFAIKECASKLVPTIGIIDSNVDPRVVMYPIPANDDSVRTAELIVGMLSMAGKEGITALERAEEVQAKQEREAAKQIRASSSGRRRNQ